ncbi:MAG: hypothetical protein QXL17_06985 [Candidatus Thermoplasmatota archaeon]
MEGMEFSKEFVEKLSRILFYQDVESEFIAEKTSKAQITNNMQPEFDRMKRSDQF